MTHRLIRCLTAAAAALGTTLAATGATAAPDVATLLKDADRWRLGAPNEQAMRIETQVTVLQRDGSLDKERRYTVFSQPPHRSLVLMRSPAEAGQKMLMLGDDFWLVLPGSQRPLRITPTQKLLGDASTGDIATLSWSEDYGGTLAGEERCGELPCLRLSLQAARKGLSYQRIELWLGLPRRQPLKAELYVQSDKLAKTARFIAVDNRIDAMVLTDELGSHKETRVQYLSRQPKTVPEAWLNPMFLARNPALD